MTDEDDGSGNLLTRVAVLEVRVRLLSIAMKGAVAIVVGTVLAYAVKGLFT